MAIGLLGRKIGMTQIFTEEGKQVPVSVLEVLPNRISQLKTLEKDGYTAMQLTAGTKKQSHVNKPLAGHFAAATVEAGDMIAEFRLPEAEENSKGYTLGQVLQLGDLFSQGQYVDVTATSKGKGFAGTVKRHNFRTQDATHGNSRSHRVPGSIGQNQTPGKVFKGKKMAGQLGNVRCTTQNLEIIRIDNERHLILVKGAVPGCSSARVLLKPAVKKQRRGE